jgi:hypothetical protein
VSVTLSDAVAFHAENIDRESDRQRGTGRALWEWREQNAQMLLSLYFVWNHSFSLHARFTR